MAWLVEWTVAGAAVAAAAAAPPPSVAAALQLSGVATAWAVAVVMRMRRRLALGRRQGGFQLRIIRRGGLALGRRQGGFQLRIRFSFFRRDNPNWFFQNKYQRTQCYWFAQTTTGADS